MTNILGPYYDPWHWRGEDEEYIRQLDPAWVLVHQPSARSVHTAQQAAPNAKIMLRSWDIDDSNGERKREMYADPIAAARKHLDMWRAKWEELVREMRVNGWQPDESRWYCQLVNEPDPAFVPQVVEYAFEAMAIAPQMMVKLGVVVSSVGTFSKPSENPNGWALCAPLEQPINDGGHILVIHEYWQPEGPNFGEDAGNLSWRHRSIPLDVPILVGEAGANGYIYGRYSKDDDSGWQKTVKDPTIYAAQVKEYIEGCDTRVKGVLLYMLDYHSDQWASFDTQPAMHQLLAIKDARPLVPSPFVDRHVTHLPNITSDKTQTPMPQTTGIIEPRVAQAILKIESGGRAFGNDGKPLIRFEAHIFGGRLGNHDLFADHFRHDSNRPWIDQMWRPSVGDPWREIHTGMQDDEYSAFSFARSLNADAAYNSISIGLAQIMGFNHARVGYPTAQAMYEAFTSEHMQVVAFFNYFLSDPPLIEAARRKDWRAIAAGYNGSGNIDYYAEELRKAYALGL